MNTEHKLSEIRQIAITVSDVGTALPFYRDVLGLPFLFSPAANLAFLEAGSVRIMLISQRNEAIQPRDLTSSRATYLKICAAPT